MIPILTLLFFLLPSAFSTPLVKRDDSIVHLDYASYRGTPLAAGITQYLGLRFAAPPTGNLRWRAPQDPPSVSGIQDASSFGPICVGVNQTVSANVTEDCLFINVFRPSNATATSKLPVWVYIQGGGYVENSNNNYNGTEVVQRSGGNLVFVNFNYRVGAYGFLASERIRENGDLNVGLLDQRKALMWVKKYIAEFGGDPDHVVIHGVSAGAGSVGTHLTAYGGRDDNLFIGAVGQSPFFPCQNTVPESEWQFDRFAAGAGCSGAGDPLACLRAQNLSTLQAADVASPFPGQTTNPLFYFTPVIDGDLIQDAPFILFEKGQYIKVPLMIGDETNEGSGFAANASSPAEVSSFLTANCPRLPASAADEANQLYPLMSPLPRHAAYFPSASAAYGEQTFICAGLLMSEALSRSQRNKVWNYRFDVASTENLAAGLGVPHTFDTAAIFGPNYSGPPSSASVASFETYNAGVVPILMDYYISFVRTLDPNRLKAGEAPVWNPFEGRGKQRLLLEINGTRMEKVPRQQQGRCRFWESLAPITEQ